MRSLWHNEPQELHLAHSVPLVGADRVWAGDGLHLAYTGEGIGIGVIDTGVDGLHPDLPYGEKVENYAMVGDVEDPDGVVMVESPTGDTYGHGTHVSSIVGGLGTMSDGGNTGVAPGAFTVNFKTDYGLFLFQGPILKSFDWMLANQEEYNIRISTNSWGGGGGEDFDPDHPINVATRELFDNGITVIFSAGNGGEPDSLNRYAVAPWVIGVAANTKFDPPELAAFSSRGRIDDNWDRRRAFRTNTGIYRPTISAPGVDIVAARSSQTTVMAAGTQLTNPFYTSASGTSMSAPHVAGAVALMYEANPGLTPEQAIMILEHTADPMEGYEMFEVGAGHLNAYEAVKLAESKRRGLPPTVTGGTDTFTELDSEVYDGIVLTNTFDLSDCRSDNELLNYHRFTVTDGVDLLYAELEWEDEQQLIYLFVYDPDCNEVTSSAGRLDLVFTTNLRRLVVSNPEPGEWTIAVYGRVNIPTEYWGKIAA